MTRTCYDTTNVPATVIPPNAEVVAGYIDGHYRSYGDMAQRFPHAVHVPIAVFPSTNGGLVLDCETGDATPSQCPAWVRMRQAAGVSRPTIYTLASWVGQVKAACSAAGLVQHRDYELWIAHYDNRPAPDGYGEAAKQYINHGPHGENYDLSAVFDDAWPYYSIQPAPVSEMLKEQRQMHFVKRVPGQGGWKGYPEITIFQKVGKFLAPILTWGDYLYLVSARIAAGENPYKIFEEHDASDGIWGSTLLESAAKAA